MNSLVELEIIDDINNIIKFLSRRDISGLTCNALVEEFGITQVDMIILLGNSIPYVAEIGSKAYKNGLSKDIMIVGGIGHSTKYLIQNVLENNKYNNIEVNDKSEAEILKQIIVAGENIQQDKIITESKSTNCGDNASEALIVLKEKHKVPKSIILIQDPTMQLRSHASFLKEWQEENTLFISYSPFIPQIKASDNGYEYINKDIKGLWDKDRFIDLIMGEIPRLNDVENGYGPKGKGFISHVDIPEEVFCSYQRLLCYYDEYNEIKNRK
ncbi:YdcF family protein [Clostridium sp.]|uniref:YdcF family protein n=1 Tax=Clostridium sp. TaxID=1506 RepID=UPI003D6D5E13